jgi:hypothetical protein
MAIYRKKPKSSGNKGGIVRPFTIIGSIIFLIIAFLHLLRLIFGWEVMINGMIIPLWISVPGFLVMAGLAFMLWRESCK